MWNRIGRFFAVIFCLFAAFGGAAVYAAQGNGPAPKQLQPVSAASVEAWSDATLKAALEQARITGAVISVVKDGEVIFAKGYGVGDVVSNAPASPEETRVRIGSTTKTFTATIIAQLIEEGRIASINDPVNQYLKRYKIPDNNGAEITLKHLLTHTAGFEDKFFFIGSDRPVDIPVDPAVFDQLRPNYVRPVGEKVVYSNFGVALLGLVIEDVTATSIDKAMTTRIFGPLGMTKTELVITIDEPTGLAKPGDIAPDGEVVGPTKFTAINPAVAQTGAIVSTASDMARYMNSQLGFGNALSANIREMLHTRIADNDASVNGLGMVFFIDSWAGHKTVAHGGNWAGFHTWMTVMPDEELGFYVTLLGNATPVGLCARFTSAAFPDKAPPVSPAMMSASGVSGAFLAHFYGPKREMPKVDENAIQDLKKLAGYYRADRRPFKTAEELSSLVYFGAGVLKIDAKEDGLYLGKAGPWKPVGGGRFVLDAGSRPLTVIKPNPRTGVATLTPEIGIYTFTKIPALANPKMHAIALHIIFPFMALGLLTPLFISNRLLSLASFLTGLGSALAMCAALAGLSAGDTVMVGYYGGYVFRLVLFCAGASLLALSSITAFVLLIASRERSFLMALFVILGLVATMILAQYNAIGFNF